MIRFFQGFKYAFYGIIDLTRTERNFKVHILLFSLVCIAGFYFRITKNEWIAVLGISALVISLEAVNSAVEKLCDLYSIDKNEKIKRIKDISAGAVLLASIFALIIGSLIFLPYLFIQICN